MQDSSGAIKRRADAQAEVLDSSFPSFPSVLLLQSGMRGRELFTEENEVNDDLAGWGGLDGLDV
jgi:hypothetical protein